MTYLIDRLTGRIKPSASRLEAQFDAVRRVEVHTSFVLFLFVSSDSFLAITPLSRVKKPVGSVHDTYLPR